MDQIFTNMNCSQLQNQSVYSESRAKMSVNIAITVTTSTRMQRNMMCRYYHQSLITCTKAQKKTGQASGVTTKRCHKVENKFGTENNGYYVGGVKNRDHMILTIMELCRCNIDIGRLSLKTIREF